MDRRSPNGHSRSPVHFVVLLILGINQDGMYRDVPRIAARAWLSGYELGDHTVLVAVWTRQSVDIVAKFDMGDGVGRRFDYELRTSWHICVGEASAFAMLLFATNSDCFPWLRAER